MNLKMPNNLFLGKEELNHLKDSLGENGYRRAFKQIAKSYGVVRLPSDVSFTSLKVIPGTTNGQLTVKAGTAIDNNVDVIEVLSDQVDILTTAGDNVTRYVVVKYNKSIIPKGTVSISATGEVTGVGTEFKKMVRGLPNFPSLIKFNDSVNTQEYQVASIAGDTSLQLNVASGVLTAETGKTYSVVGTFTPGIAVPTGSKYPLELDGYTLSLEATPTVTEGVEFVLAAVQNNGAVTSITDMRTSHSFEIIGSDDDESMTETSVVIGHDSVRNPHAKSPKDVALLTTTWSFNSTTTNWLHNAATQKLTITAGSGGSLVDVSATSTGDFDGWKVFEKNTGNTVRVIASTRVGANMVLDLEYIESMDLSSEIKIVPDADLIEFTTNLSESFDSLINKRFLFNINDGTANMELVTGKTYRMLWRHIKGTNVTKWNDLNDGAFQPPANHNAVGVYVGGTATAYVAVSGIVIADHAKNHQDDKASRTDPNTFTLSSTNTFDGSVTINKEFILGTYVTGGSLAPITNHNSTVFEGYASTTSNASSGDVTFTGFTGGTNGRYVVFQSSVLSTSNIILTHDDVGSSSGNRMILKNGKSIVLSGGDSITMRYDSIYNRWVEVSSTVKAPWTIYNVPMTLTGSSVINWTHSLDRTRYRWADNNTLMITVYKEFERISGAPTITQAALPLPVNPSSPTSLLQQDVTGRVVASSTGSNTGQTQRPCVVNITAGQIRFTNSFDSAAWTHNSDLVVLSGTFIIAYA